MPNELMWWDVERGIYSSFPFGSEFRAGYLLNIRSGVETEETLEASLIKNQFSQNV